MSPVRQNVPIRPWMRAPATRAVLGALRAAGGEVRFVGGCVRDAILGHPVEDIDLATTLRPEATQRALEVAGLKAVPTGIEHGTITAVSRGRPYEITTLRHDVETDGRHAVVAYTDDWAADAERRDFTLNALYCDETGEVIDYVGGLADLERHVVRFVGDPRARIAEDVLRVLRFFRFSAWYGRPPYDGAGLAACGEAAALLRGLSAERVRKEALRLLEAPDPVPALSAAHERGLFSHWVPEAHGTTVLAVLVRFETTIATVDGLRRLAALLRPNADADVIAERLKLSRREASRLAAMLAVRDAVDLDGGPRAWRRSIHAFGNALFIDRLLLQVACDGAETKPWREAHALAVAWKAPRLPVGGNDVLALGVPSGMAVGELIRGVERWWIDGDFQADRDACLAFLEREVRARGRAC
jgi:poly(A) polymerase